MFSKNHKWAGPPMGWLLAAVLGGLVAIGPAGLVAAQEDPAESATASAADYFPASTALYVDIKKPAELIETIENHSLLKAVLELKQVKQLMGSPQFAMAMLGRGLLEARIDETIFEALKTNTAQGLTVGFDPKSEGAIVLFQSADQDRLKFVVGQVLKLVTASATQDGKPTPFKKHDYRGAVAAEFEGFMIFRYESWLGITNKSELAKQVVDKMNDDTGESLAGQDWFRKATASRRPADIWTAVDVATIRQLLPDQEPFSGRTDNPGVELVFGGILDALKHTPLALSELNLDQDLTLSISVPFEGQWADQAREYFYGKQQHGVAPPTLTTKRMIASLTSYRDVGLWWLSKEDLYAENVIAQLAQVDSQLSTVFPGMDFGPDVLGALEPGVQIIVAENEFDPKYVPDVKLPAFALVGTLKDPEQVTRKLKIAFQTVIGIANAGLGMNGQPQLEVATEKRGDSQLVTGEYFYEEGTEEGLLLFNFAPTIAFHGSHVVIASNQALAAELIDLVSSQTEQTPQPTAQPINTHLEIEGRTFRDVLVANRESLVAQNMIEDGNERAEAEVQIDLLLAVAELFRDFQLDYQTDSDEMRADLRLRFLEPNTQR